MPGATLSLSFERLDSLLSELGLGAMRLEPALPTVALYLAAQARRCFDEGRSPFGVPWPPLKNPSARRGGASAKPLRDTGVLMASYTANTGPGKGAYQASRAALEWGSNVDYAGYHQTGTRHMPDRPALGLTSTMLLRIRDIVVDRLEAEAKKTKRQP